ncbi:PREDICTED: hemicentin-1-like isoform X3 [Acropora digitifera]|uniref:hemicentin-1-like isoform X3 n=1 Tax=Acropora digitifera TaxID=70779 RepID=UPI00077AE813|nr:PREDICTED: hemicentin-1-like isoform X3 [Acropora digitifera]
MDDVSNFVTFLLTVLLSCPESETATTAFTTKPTNPTIAEEGRSFTLKWTYTLDGTVVIAQFFNTTGGGSVLIGKAIGTGNVSIESDYQGQFSGLVTNTKAELTTVGMQRSELLTCRFVLTPTISGALSHDVEIIIEFSSNIPRLPGKTAIEGENVTLECRAVGNPEPNITWARLSENHNVTMPLTNVTKQGAGMYSCVSVHYCILLLTSVSRHLAGMYRCTADNGVGSRATGDVLLDVQYPVEAIGFGRNATLPQEGQVTLSCPVDGNPKPNVSWYRGSEVRGMPISREEKLQAGESGCYTCAASNYLGKQVITQCLDRDDESSTSSTRPTTAPIPSQTVIGVVVGVTVFVVIVIGLVTWCVCKKKTYRKHAKLESCNM